ncbi:MAG: YCF48-related protein [Gammaproteobacteria bacterium]|jgi:photosystem II stability/assembly factor-like uncharacterized protein|nr:YCF48-related protein [Gammaproteobacteria bacterium]
MRFDALANLRRKRRIFLQILAILFAVTGLVVTSEGRSTRFQMLPALPTEAASDSLILDAVTEGQRTLIAGEQGHILYSDDNGTSWTHAQVPVSLSITAVTFCGVNCAWVAGHDGILLRSTDRGESWQTNFTGTDIARLSADAAEATIRQLEAEIEQASPDEIPDLEWELEDAQFALDDASAALEDGVAMPLLDIWFRDERNGFALGAYGIMLQTRDGGSTWSLISDRLDNPDDFHLYGIARSASGTLLVAGEAGTLLRSRDDGESWDRPDAPYQGSFFGIVAARDGGFIAFGLRGNVFRSTDEGDSWMAVETGDERTLLSGMTRSDGTIVLVGSAGAVLASNDNGTSFETLSTSGNRVYSGVTETPDGKIMLVGFGGVSIADGVDSHE